MQYVYMYIYIHNKSVVEMIMTSFQEHAVKRLSYQ